MLLGRYMLAVHVFVVRNERRSSLYYMKCKNTFSHRRGIRKMYFHKSCIVHLPPTIYRIILLVFYFIVCAAWVMAKIYFHFAYIYGSTGDIYHFMLLKKCSGRYIFESMGFGLNCALARARSCVVAFLLCIFLCFVLWCHTLWFLLFHFILFKCISRDINILLPTRAPVICG